MIDVVYTYWPHKRKWRVRAWQEIPGNDFGRVLYEKFVTTEKQAKALAEKIAKQHGVKVRE